MGDLGTERHNPSTLRPNFEGGAAAGELKVENEEMSMSVIDSQVNNRFAHANQEQRASLLRGLSKKSIDELRYLVVEFRRASVRVHFSSAEWKWLDRARVRLQKLEAEAMR
jgi:hypothetical protein